MSFMNRSGSFGAILPTFFTHQHPTQEPTSITTEEKPKRKWSDIFRGLSIDTTIARSPSTGGTMVASAHRTASPVEAGDGVDGTFERIIPSNSQPNEKGPLTGKTLCEEEKPGNGHVWDIWPIMPKSVRRWDKPDPIPIAHMQIPAGSLVMNRRMDPLPEGWTMYIHPEGKPYYHRVAQEPEDNLLQGTLLYGKGKPICRPLPIVTDSDPRNPVTRKTLEHAHFITRVTVAENDLELPEHTELFLELYPEREPDLHPYAGYYLADHDNQTVFWAAPISTTDLGAHPVNPGTFADQHLKLQLSHQYWQHVECYPIDANIDIKQAEHALLEQLSFMYLDIATSHTSTAPWTEAQCQTYISMLHHTPASRKTWTVSRLMALMVDWQFQNLYGHPSARLDRTHSYEIEVKPVESVASDEQEQASINLSLIEESKERTFRERCIDFRHGIIAILLRLCSLLLFEAPMAHNSALELVWVDKIVNKVRFQNLIDKTVKDWGDISLLATVLWTANMAFLAIPYPILDPQRFEPLTETQNVVRLAMITASLASTVFSVGSIAISLLHMRKHRMERTAQEYCDFLQTEHHQLYGHRPLAILWSLPFAFLMWSVLTFSAAVMLFCVTAGVPGGLVPKIPLLAQSGFIIASIFLTVWYFWKRETRWTSTVEGVQRPSFRMIFTNWFWDLKRVSDRYRSPV